MTIELTWAFWDDTGLGCSRSVWDSRQAGLCLRWVACVLWLLGDMLRITGLMGKVTAGKVRGDDLQVIFWLYYLEVPCSTGFMLGVYLMPIDQIYDCNMLL